MKCFKKLVHQLIKHPCQPRASPACIQNQQIHGGCHCPALNRLIRMLFGDFSSAFDTIIAMELTGKLNTNVVWVQHSATRYWTSSDVDPREYGLIFNPQPRPVHTVRPWLHPQTSLELYCEVWVRHHHHRAALWTAMRVQTRRKWRIL